MNLSVRAQTLVLPFIFNLFYVDLDSLYFISLSSCRQSFYITLSLRALQLCLF